MAEILCTEAEGTVTVNRDDEIGDERERERLTQAGELAVRVSATAGLQLGEAGDEVVVTEGQEVPLPVSPPVEQSRVLEVVRTELGLCWPGGDWRGDQLDISHRLHLDILPLLPLLLLLPRLQYDDEPELAVVPGGGGHLVEVV